MVLNDRRREKMGVREKEREREVKDTSERTDSE